ncbi:MAG: RNA-binding transcriptional accessory protein, partial [Spirosomaceae bacterium]|nr:RNA-binding transcriptional accessory protein [Spirosomataceae bacterium]
MILKQLQYICKTVGVSEQSVKNTIELFKDGATLPFVARYRKEVTGGLDEVQLADIKSLFEKLAEADKRREAIIKSIDEQGKLTDDLLKKLNQALLTPELEDIYLPYKQKRKTRATIAIEKGLEPLAKTIFEQKERDVQNLAKRFLNKDVNSTEEALQGARDIIAEWINEDIQARNVVRNVFEKTAIVTSKVKKGKEQEGEKFKDYFDYSEELKRIPSHRLLAIRRGENEGFLKVKMDIDDERALNSLDRIYLQGMPECKDQVADALEDAFKRLLSSSVENEFAKLSKEKADTAAIEIFTT